MTSEVFIALLTAAFGFGMVLVIGSSFALVVTWIMDKRKAK